MRISSICGPTPDGGRLGGALGPNPAGRPTTTSELAVITSPGDIGIPSNCLWASSDSHLAAGGASGGVK